MVTFISFADNDSARGIAGTGTILPASFLIPKPPCAVGDLIILMCGTQELADGWGAAIMNTGGIADFTDLFTDGTSDPDTAKQYVLVDVSHNVARMFWWIGWKFADAGDAAGGSYTVNCKASLRDPFLGVGVNPGVDRLKSSAIVYSGTTGIDVWAAQTFADGSATMNTVTCPGVTPTGEDATGDFEFDVFEGNGAPLQGGVTIALTPATSGEKHLILCGGFGWLAAGVLVPVAPLVEREESRTGGLPDSLSWAEMQRLHPWLKAPIYVGHDG